MDLYDLTQMEFLNPKCKAGNTLSVFTDAFRLERVINHFDDRPVALLSIPHCKGEILVLAREEGEAAFHDIVDIVFPREILDNGRIQLEFRSRILDQILVGRRAFLDFSILNLFRTSDYLVEKDLLYGQIKSILFIGGFHTCVFLWIA